MAVPTNTLIVEGSFEELCDEFAAYLDGLSKESLQAEIQPLLQEGNKEEVLKKLVTASTALNNAPEREYLAAYNQLVQLVRQAPTPVIFLARICQNLTQPNSSSLNSSSLQLNVLTTIFNTLPSDSESRYHVLLSIVSVIRKSTPSFEILRPQLKELDIWLQKWELDADASRKLYLAISETAAESGDAASAYQYLLRALSTIDAGDSEEAHSLSVKALSSALSSPSTYDFSDLTALDAIQALRKSEPIWFELLEIFAAENLDDYHDFLSAHGDWFDQQNLPANVLETKMRLLTLSSLAASAGQTRVLPYSAIAKALKIESGDVEMWVIDVIRAGLVEGKLSQSNQQFLIHRATYRVFGESQWREVAARLSMWRSSLEGVLKVLAEQKKEFAADREREAREEQAQQQQGYRRRNFQKREPAAVEVD